MTSVLTPRAATDASVRPVQQRHLPRWALPTLLAFCLLQLILLVYTRTVSGLAHLHTVQEINLGDLSPGTAAAACSEGLAVADDLWPAVPMLNLGRILPLPRAHAWAQLPTLVEVARRTCPSVELYARVAPSLDRSLDDGVAADLLVNVRRDRDELTTANHDLGLALQQVDNLDLDALSAEPRLARIAQAVSALRQQRAEVSDAFGIMTPQTLEDLLGGSGPRSIVLRVDGTARGQAYLVLDEGKLVNVGLDSPDVPPVAIVTVDDTGLDSLRASLPHAVVPDDAHENVIAEALLASLTQRSLIESENVAAVLKHAADDHHAWFWFEDARLQELATGRGWIRQ